MYHVFVSYSTHDIQWVSYLKHLLRDAQIGTFVAEYDIEPGRQLSDEIIKQVKRCDLFLLLWSRNSEASKYVQNEIFLAKSERRPILPLIIQPGLRLPDILGDLKYLPLDRDPEAALNWLKKHVATSASQKVVSDFLAVGLMAFLGWALLSGAK